MTSLIEMILAKLNITLSSNNKDIIKQINRYEQKRAMIAKAENELSILAAQFEKELLKDTATLYRSQAELKKTERERIDRNIERLISKLEPDSTKRRK
jgi:hypothetical protein